MATTVAADPDPPTHPLLVPPPGTADDRRAWGKALRANTSRDSHADWSLPADRPHPVALIQEQDAGRIQDLVPIRHGRMLDSAFTFYRGAAFIMASDLARTPTSGITVQACGDAHLSNFGVFATPERRLIFDVNDFDETYPAPFEWDVKRLAASMVIAGRDNGFDDRTNQKIAAAAVSAYQKRMAEIAAMRTLEAWYQRYDVDPRLQEALESHEKSVRKRAKKFAKKASSRTHVGALGKLAEETRDGWRIRAEPPLIVPFVRGDQRRAEVEDALFQYVDTLPSDVRVLLRQYGFADAARKVVGVGSVGTAVFIILMVGNRSKDPIFLQGKEASPSVLERYTQPDLFEHQGERVVHGQRLIQEASDQLLGWLSADRVDRRYDFYVRQLRDWKYSFHVEDFDEGELYRYGRACGEVLAQGHGRSGSANAIAGYLGKNDDFAEAVATFGVAYADQNQADYATMLQAETDGRIEVVRGV